jgi:subtilisin family serine protease
VERPQFRPRDIIVAISAAPDARIGLMRDYNLQATPERDIALIEARIVRLSLLDNRPLDGVIAQLQADPRVMSVQPNYIYGVDGEETAALAQAQYNIAALKVPAAHRISIGRDVKVAVIDTCVDGTHPALDTAITSSFDATAQTGATCEGAEHHGTSVAGIIAARASLQGVAPGASVLAARAFSVAEGASVEGTTETLLVAMDWAIGEKAQVLNLSFTGPRDPLVERAIAASIKKGALVVAAAGNKGPEAEPLYPAAYPQVIAVSASYAKNEVYSQANRGAHVAITAPGVDVLTLRPKGGYDFGSGTSYAAAHIAGVAALLIEQNPGLDPAALRDLIVATANDLGDAGHDEVFGAGLADAEAAVRRNGAAAGAAKVSAAAK